MDKKITIGIVVNMLGGATMATSLNKMGTAARGVSNSFSGMQAAIGAAGIVAGIRHITSAYGDLADAQGEIASLGIGDAGIGLITQAATQFSSTWAGTTRQDFIKASYDIKSGIETLGDAAVGEFTKIAALTGKATKSSTAEMTSLFASGYGIYRGQFDQFGKQYIKGWEGLSQESRDIKFGEYFSAGIASSVQAFKTTGPQMSAAISNLGAEATSAGIAFSEQLAILGQLQATMGGSEAATKYRSFLQSAYRAGEKLGLEFTDLNGRLKTMPEILTEIQMAYGDTLDAASANELKEAFGTDEAVALIKLLLPQIENLKKNTGKMQTSLQKGMQKTTEMAKAMERGPNSAMEKMGQQFEMISQDIGKHFAPVMGKAIASVTAFGKNIQELIKTNPEMVTQIGWGVAAFGALMGVTILAKTVMFAFNAVTMMTNVIMLAWHTTIFVVKAALVGLRKALVLARTATIGLNLALLANPFVLVGAAIVGVVSIIYTYWTPISSFFSNIWTNVKASFGAAWEWIVGALGFDPMQTLATFWAPLGEFFSNIWSSVRDTFTVTWGWISETLGFDPLAPLTAAWSGTTALFGTVIDGITGAWSAFFDWMGEKFKWFGDMVGAVKGLAGKVLGLFSDETPQSPAMGIAPTVMPPANNPSYTPNALESMGAPLGTLPSSTQNSTITTRQEIKVDITFGDIIVTATDGKIDNAALRRQIQSTVDDAVRRALQDAKKYQIRDAS